jgi:hypothetical protein
LLSILPTRRFRILSSDEFSGSRLHLSNG